MSQCMENTTQENFQKYFETYGNVDGIYELVCGRCGKKFYVKQWYYRQLAKANKGRGYFCSRKCAAIKHHVSQETREKIRLSQIGMPRPQSGLSNEKHSQWKGDNVKRNPLHRWIRRHFPPPELCPSCGQKKKLDLANTGIYNRDFNNWKYLCQSCHKYHDYANGLRQHPTEETKKKIAESNKKTYWERRLKHNPD